MVCLPRRKIARNPIAILKAIKQKQNQSVSLPYFDFGVVHRSVLFQQHRLENEHPGLCEGGFFIACLWSLAKVNTRRRGASPSRPVWSLS
jgi:hypothetical protein